MSSKKIKSRNLLKELRGSGAHSDLTIKCGDALFQVHKCIVCPQSTFFKKACEEQKWKEGYTSVIELKAAEGDHPDLGDDDPQAIKLMVDYLYLGDYDPGTLLATETVSPAENGEGTESTEIIQPQPDETPDPDPWGYVPKPKKKKKGGFRAAEPDPEASHGACTSFLEMHAKVFAIASKYDIKSLEQTSGEKFESQSESNWEAPDLIAAIEVVFHRTPEHEERLREALEKVIVRRACFLLQYPGFEEAIASIDGLAYDLFWRRALETRTTDDDP